MGLDFCLRVCGFTFGYLSGAKEEGITFQLVYGCLQFTEDTKIKQTDTNDIKSYIKRNYTSANVWVNGIQIMRNGRVLGQRGRDYFSEKIEVHKRWMKKKKIKKADAVCAGDAG